MRNKFFTLTLLMLSMVFVVNAQKDGLTSIKKEYEPNKYKGADAVSVSWATQSLAKGAYTYNPDDSPLGSAYDSDTYAELGWTDIVVAESGGAGDIEITYTWDTDSWPGEGSFHLESPTGTAVVIGDGETDGTYSKVLTDFVGEEVNGTWKLWIEDSYGDGGHSAADITFVVKTLEVNDMSAIAITPTFVFEGDDATPTITVRNAGINLQDAFDVDVVINDGASDVYTSTKSITGAGLTTGDMLTVTMDDVWTMPANGDYTITGTVTLAGDADLNNNTIVSTFMVGTWGDAYTGNTSAGVYNAVTFADTAFDAVGVMGSDPFPMAEEFDGTNVYRIYNDFTIGTVNPVGEYTLLDTITNVTGTPVGLAYDWINDMMYALVLDGSSNPQLGTIDMGTFEFTLIGTGTTTLIAMDMANDGYLYGPSLTDESLYKIDPATGATTLVGPSGLTDINFGQDVSYDPVENKLYSITSGDQNYYGTYSLVTGEFSMILDMGSDQYATFVVTKEAPAMNVVTFNVVDDSANPLEGAKVDVINLRLLTDAAGDAMCYIPDGDADYSAFLAGYEGVTGTVTVAGDVTESIVLNEIPPQLSVDPTSYDFGDVYIDYSVTQAFNISNIGTGVLTVNDISLTGADIAEFEIISIGGEADTALWPDTWDLATGEVAEIVVEFTPATEAPKTVSLTITDNATKATTEVEITGNALLRPAGSTCALPYEITLPLVDFNGNTEDKGDDYSNTWIDPNSYYINGNDMVFEFTLAERSVIEANMTSTGTWIGLFIVQDCPTDTLPAPVFGSATSSGSEVNLTDVVLDAGTYFAIVSSWPSPQTIEFTLNMDATPVYDVVFNVTDGTDPIEGAEILINEVTLTTAADGNDTIELPVGTYDYKVTYTGFGPQFGTVDVVDAAQTISVVMDAAYDVTFSVTDGTDPIEGAAVSVNDFEMGTTDATGALVVALSDGTYNYDVTATGYAEAAGSVTVSGAILTEDVVMDTVYEVAFAVVDEFGAAMEGATVTIDGEDLMTDGAGEASTLLVAGNYPYAVNMDGYTEVTGAVDVIDTTVNVDVEMMLIRYTVTFFAKDNNDVVLEGVDIDVEGTVVTTDATGYAMLDTINGTYDYTATITGYAAILGEVVVADADITEEIVFEEPAYTVTFTVDDGTDPIEGATVAVGGLEGTTDATGVVEFDLPAGDHDYLVTYAGYDDVTGTVTVVDAPVTVPTITMVETVYNINFVVEDEWDAAIEGATITFDGEDMVTNASGVATFQRVNGTYAWSIVAAGYEDTASSVDVTNGNVTLNVEMIALRYTATFTVDNAIGTLLEGASIEIDDQTLTTDASGVATVELPNGVYDYTVMAAGYDEYMGSITVADADLAEDVEMVETITAPSGLVISNIDPIALTATFAWNQGAGGFSDSFEDQTFDAWGEFIQGPGTPGDGDKAYWAVEVADGGAAPDGTYVGHADWGYGVDTWLITPEISIASGTAITFNWNKSYYWSVDPNDNDDLMIKVSNDGGTTWTVLWTENDYGVFDNFTWYETTLDLSAYAGTAMIAFHLEGDDNATNEIDMITIGTAKRPFGTRAISDAAPVAANAKTDNGYKYNFLAGVKEAQSYDVYLNDLVNPIATDMTGDSYELTGLTVGTHTAGVVANYLTGASDMATIEFEVPNPAYTVTFNVTSSGTAVEGATIDINSETITTDAAGVATIMLEDGTYSYSVTADGFEDATGEVIVAGADVTEDVDLTGMGDVNANFSIYPNPTTGMLYIKANGTNEVTVLNAIGNVVKTQQIEGNDKIDLSGYAEGIYFIRLKSDNKVATKRIIVE